MRSKFSVVRYKSNGPEYLNNSIMFGEELEPPLEAAMAAVEIRMNNEVIESVLDQDHRKIFNAARDGQAITLYALLKDQATPEQHHILNMPVQEGDGQNCPPLVIAARNGHDNVVQTLISKVHILFLI